MPWDKGPMETRKRLIEAWEQGERPASLARQFGVSRPTVYATIAKWVEDECLEDRSRRPLTNSRQTSSEVTAALLDLKDQYPYWGPDKLVRLLADDGVTLSASTARDILRRNGRVEARRARRPFWSPVVTPQIAVPTVGHSMSADYKGEFRLGNGQYCYPLTIADPASRYIFAIAGGESTSVRRAIRVFEHVFRKWGLPEQIITDNGNPFCSARTIGGITALSKMWIKLGIQHVRIQRGRPQQNGAHERMHRTLKREATRPPGSNQTAQQRRFDKFRREFNEIRPHESLGQERPASKVTSYRRSYPTKMPPIEYPTSFETRSVRDGGMIKWGGELLFVSEVLVGERIALVRQDNERWNVYFGPVRLALWNERTKRFEAPIAQAPAPLEGRPSSVLPLGEDAPDPASASESV